MNKDDSTKFFRPWGYYEILAGGDTLGFKIKKIVVFPNKKLSLQSHKHRRELWYCLEGKGTAQLDDNFRTLTKGIHLLVEQNQKHRLINDGNYELVIIENQYGDYLGEDDIIRYEDDFGRV